MVKKGKLWIQGANVMGHKGALSGELGIPVEDDIPFTLLEAIVGAKIGGVVVNPTQSGHARFRVTPLLKKRSVLALNLKRINKK